MTVKYLEFRTFIIDGYDPPVIGWMLSVPYWDVFVDTAQFDAFGYMWFVHNPLGHFVAGGSSKSLGVALRQCHKAFEKAYRKTLGSEFDILVKESRQ